LLVFKAVHTHAAHIHSSTHITLEGVDIHRHSVTTDDVSWTKALHTHTDCRSGLTTLLNTSVRRRKHHVPKLHACTRTVCDAGANNVYSHASAVVAHGHKVFCDHHRRNAVQQGEARKGLQPCLLSYEPVDDSPMHTCRVRHGGAGQIQDCGGEGTRCFPSPGAR
jgi:hypothetical protein